MCKSSRFDLCAYLRGVAAIANKTGGAVRIEIRDVWDAEKPPRCGWLMRCYIGVDRRAHFHPGDRPTVLLRVWSPPEAAGFSETRIRPGRLYTIY